MEDVNKAIPTKTANNHGLNGIILDPPEPPTVENAPENIKPSIHTRIADDLHNVENMLNGEKAEEYGNPRIMFQNISQRWFGRDDAEVDVAIMMAELKIERIKHDHSKEDSYLDAIAYLTMALAFMQESDNRNVTRLTVGREEWRKIESAKPNRHTRPWPSYSPTPPPEHTSATPSSSRTSRSATMRPAPGHGACSPN